MLRRSPLLVVAIAVVGIIVAGFGSAAYVYATSEEAYPFAGLPFGLGDPPDSTILANDNRRPAGRLVDGVLTLRLEATQGDWWPEGPRARSVRTAAWREEGELLQTPGPLIRVPAGTEVHVTVRNSLAKPLRVYGLGAKRGTAADSLILQPGETKEARFTATTPGTYYYAGQTVPGPLAARVEEDSQLHGAIIVDPAGTTGRPIDRVFVISWWFTLDSTSRTGLGRGTMAINGLSWPHTERFDVAQGDSLHWRWINLTSLDHPMHLHGFYFRMETKGDGALDTVYAPEAQRMAVTEIIDPGQTMRLSWSPTRAGNWIYHCHFAGHITPHLTAIDAERGELPHHDVLETSHPSDRPHHMSALILGIRVAPRGPAPVAPADARAMRLEIRSKQNVYGDKPGFAFVLGGTPAEADPTAMPLPGPPLILERNQPVAINVVNRGQEQAAVHWHGIELESFPDGVPHWSGNQRSMLPTIAPGDSLTVRFTPPRAGTFMYHSHFNEFNQITSGLYGAIIVLEPGQRYDPETDRVLIFSEYGPMVNVIAGPFAPHTLNGQVRPDPMEFRAGTTYRLRLINIKSDIPSMVKLLDGTKPVLWRAVAKDGADLPESQRRMVPADLRFDPGEIYDFEFTPARAARLKLEFGFPVIPPLAMTPVEVRVR